MIQMSETSEAIFAKLTPLLDTPGPAELGPGPRKGVCDEAALNHELDKLFGSASLPDQQQQLIRALLLLWHDHFESSHSISQATGNADGAFVHGILHRREPDYSNAAYWFRRVGPHAVFQKLADRSRALAEKAGRREMIENLVKGERWDAFGYIDACEQANRRGVPESETNLLRQIQQIETRLLLESFCNPAE